MPLTGQSVAASNTTDCSDLFEDSGCDISSDCTENLPSLSLRGHDFNRFPPPILSNVLPTLTSSKNQSVMLHMQFLQHFIEIRNLAESNSMKMDLMKLGRDCSVVSNSFFQLLDGLVTSYNLPEQPFPDFMTQAVFIIAKLLNDADFSCRILGRCLKKLEDSMERLVQIILNSSYLNRVSKIHSRNYCISKVVSIMTIQLYDISLCNVKHFYIAGNSELTFCMNESTEGNEFVNNVQPIYCMSESGNQCSRSTP